MNELRKKTKPICISKRGFVAAWKSVKANKGASGVDEETLKEFSANLQRNLYKVWNRMSSGSYFPPPVRKAEIQKKDGGKRMLGIPTVADRVAQTVIKNIIEPRLEPVFHEDSYGYRPRKSALQAVGVARKRCWQKNWCIDLDIKGFFDNLDHELVMKAINVHVEEKWIQLYIKRWLQAPLQNKDGTLEVRSKGTPQGGVISPLLANVFMHYAFDAWMSKHYPNVKFERYADDILVHCDTSKQAVKVLEAIQKRLKECRLELHPAKTKIIYCKDENRKDSHEHQSFEFLGYTFRPRQAKGYQGKIFVSFMPAISNLAKKKIYARIRSWKLHLQNNQRLKELAKKINVQVQGWVNYYGKYYKSALTRTLTHINDRLAAWSMRKYKGLRGHKTRAIEWVEKVMRNSPSLFVHWKILSRSQVG